MQTKGGGNLPFWRSKKQGGENGGLEGERKKEKDGDKNARGPKRTIKEKYESPGKEKEQKSKKEIVIILHLNVSVEKILMVLETRRQKVGANGPAKNRENTFAWEDINVKKCERSKEN